LICSSTPTSLDDDDAKIEGVVLARTGESKFEYARVYKRNDFAAMNHLREKVYMSDPDGKQESARLTERRGRPTQSNGRRSTLRNWFAGWSVNFVGRPLRPFSAGLCDRIGLAAPLRSHRVQSLAQHFVPGGIKNRRTTAIEIS
jgi:hypothetical protein